MRKKNRSFTLFALVIAAFVAIFIFISSAKEFEKTPPKIEIAELLYWNLKQPIKIKISDDSGIKFVHIKVSDGSGELVLINEIYQDSPKELTLDLVAPKSAFFIDKNKSYKIEIEANDKSWWNFFSGNQSKKTAQLVLDFTKPEVYTLANSYSISRGGAAAVVFHASDKNLDQVFIRLKSGEIFKPFKFKKDDFYAAIIAWPATNSNFSAELVATDLAGNESVEHIRYYHGNRRYRESKITLRDSFIDGKISALATEYAKDSQNLSRLEKMRFVNETLRNANEKLIHSLSLGVNAQSPFSIAPFYPLKNGKKVADFADHRYYVYGPQKEIVSQSWHMGLDLASTAAAPIIASNSAEVVFAGENGIYGQMLLLDHGWGIYSLYSHCSNLLLKQGDKVSAGEHIANTGTTGLALGDHLHFGVLIQGIEVLPQEWMDKKWINDNISSIFAAANKLISK